MKRQTIALLGLVGLLLAGAPAWAMKSTFLLEPTVGPIAASGVGQIVSLRGTETFKVRVFAEVKDGTSFVVLVERPGPLSGDADGLTPVGLIEISLGSGLLSIDTDHHVSPAFPVRDLKRVVVQYQGKTILEGNVFSVSDGE